MEREELLICDMGVETWEIASAYKGGMWFFAIFRREKERLRKDDTSLFFISLRMLTKLGLYYL